MIATAKPMFLSLPVRVTDPAAVRALCNGLLIEREIALCHKAARWISFRHKVCPGKETKLYRTGEIYLDCSTGQGSKRKTFRHPIFHVWYRKLIIK